MYNHELKSIFVHIPKTAGWTLHKTLKNKYGFRTAGHGGNFRKKCWGKSSSNPWVSVRHYPSKMLTDEYLNDYFKFTFVRNPWDIVVSSFFWWSRKFGKFKYHRKRKLQKEIMQMSFNEFVKSEYSTRINEVPTDDLGQHFWLTDDAGNILVDFIGRFENLQEDFNVVCDKLGLPKQELPHKNKSKHKHYTEYYDDETREIVAEKYAKDIEYFGYKFGE